jgi:DAACS family dicarboxylate/amino acid:cation (Na+ or H+) symporter
MRMPLHIRIVIGLAFGAITGIICHIAFPDSPQLVWVVENVANPIGQIFLRLLFMLVIPLVVSALILGVAELGDVRRLGKIGLKTFLYTVVVSSIAVFIGLTLVNVVQPGKGLPDHLQAQLLEQAAAVPAPATGTDLSGPSFLVNLIPKNPIQSAADGDMLALMVFALFFGMAMAVVPRDKTRGLTETLEGIFAVSIKLTGWVLAIAPFGVTALLFSLTARLGYDILQHLGLYVLVVLGGLLFHHVVIYSLSVRLLAKMSPRFFFRSVEDAMLMAFSTASSTATLPTAIKVAEENLKLPPQISRFVLTLGAAANQNGTALFEGVTVLFLAQFYGIELSIGQQIVVVLICIMGGIGTAGVPAASIPVVIMILGIVGVPAEGIGMILGVDRLLDMARTTLNVTGDLAAAVVVSHGEELPESLPYAPVGTSSQE